MTAEKAKTKKNIATMKKKCSNDYKAAVKKAADVYRNSDANIKAALESIFPEFKETEDAKIADSLIKLVRHCHEDSNLVRFFGVEYDAIIAWLNMKYAEEMDPRYDALKDLIAADDICQMSQNDEIIAEAKAKAADALSMLGVTELLGLRRASSGEDDETIAKENAADASFSFPESKRNRRWNIRDAKDGDILSTVKGKRPFIFKGLLDPFHPTAPVAYCGIDADDGFFVPFGIAWWTDEDVRPATKEEKELLFNKMHSTGYVWIPDKKELRPV